VLALVVAAAARAVPLPGVKTPSRNISCFWVPERPSPRGHLLCDIRHAAYTGTLQQKCMSPPTQLDWHGFELPARKVGQIVCAGGLMYDARDKPAYVVLGYGKVWRHRGFTCASRVTGLTCTNRAGHGLFLSRGSYRVF